MRLKRPPYKGYMLVAYFKYGAIASGFSHTLVEGITKESRHQFDKQGYNITPAYVAKIKLPFFTGWGLERDLKKFSKKRFGVTGSINTNYKLPDSISGKIKAILADTPIEFTFRIIVSDFEYHTMFENSRVMGKVDEPDFFKVTVPCA